MRTTFVTAVTVVALLAAASCGGGDDDAASDVAEVVDDVANSVEDAVDDAAASADDVVDDVVDEATDVVDDAQEAVGDAGSGSNTATVTVGDQTFEFEWEADAIQRCDPDFFGGFWALAASVDDGPGLDAVVWPEDAADPTQVSKVEVQQGDENYTANPEATAGASAETWPAQVDSFEIDGNRVTGTATFVANFVFGEEPEAVPGTFDITCSG